MGVDPEQGQQRQREQGPAPAGIQQAHLAKQHHQCEHRGQLRSGGETERDAVGGGGEQRGEREAQPGVLRVTADFEPGQQQRDDGGANGQQPEARPAGEAVNPAQGSFRENLVVDPRCAGGGPAERVGFLDMAEGEGPLAVQHVSPQVVVSGVIGKPPPGEGDDREDKGGRQEKAGERARRYGRGSQGAHSSKRRRATQAAFMQPRPFPSRHFAQNDNAC